MLVQFLRNDVNSAGFLLDANNRSCFTCIHIIILWSAITDINKKKIIYRHTVKRLSYLSNNIAISSPSLSILAKSSSFIHYMLIKENIIACKISSYLFFCAFLHHSIFFSSGDFNHSHYFYNVFPFTPFSHNLM